MLSCWPPVASNPLTLMMIMIIRMTVDLFVFTLCQPPNYTLFVHYLILHLPQSYLLFTNEETDAQRSNKHT